MRLLVSAVILITIVSCGKDNEVILIRYFELPPYHMIKLNAVFEVEIIEDEQYSIQISGVEDLLEDLTYEVINQQLIIDNHNSKLWKHPKSSPPKLIISGKGLSQIEAKETCNIKTLNAITTENFGILLGGKLNIADLLLDCKSFYYWNTSPVGGKLTLKGKVENIAIYNGALMAVDASELPCNVATVYNGSKADVRVFVRHRLDYSIAGTGNIYLSGDPNEIVAGDLYSTGKLIQ